MSARPKRSTSDAHAFNMWVSTNKVLIGSVGGPKRPHCRNPNFDSEETKLLISIWGDPNVQKTLVTTHKKHPVITKLADKMREYGYNRSTEEINTRIKNLKCFYNRIKKDLETGVINETSWKHFPTMDEIMTRPIFGNNQQQSSLDSDAGPSTTKNQSTDRIEVKLEMVTDEDKEIRTDELLKNAEQVELKEPNLLIPKDEPMDQDNDDDPDDPDFENDGDDEEESIDSDDSDESDFDIDDERRRARLRRRASRKTSKANANKKVSASKPTATNVTTVVAKPVVTSNVTSTVTSTATSTVTATITPATAQTTSAIKFINYTGKPGINISTLVPNPNMLTTSTGQNMAIVSATPTTTTTSTSAKISLVPTNFLLKQQAPNISNISNLNFNSPIQLYTKPTVSMANSMPTSVVCSSASGGHPMKLLLVNTANGQKQQIITSATNQIYTTTSSPMVRTPTATQISIQPKPVITSAGSLTAIPQKKAQEPSPAAVTISPVTPKQGGFKALLGQLVSVQRENLALSRSRMNVERERLNNEKQIVCSLVEALNDLNNMLQTYSSTVNVSDEFGFGTSHQLQSTNDSEKESIINDINQDVPPVGNLIPVIDTIKAEVISDSD